MSFSLKELENLKRTNNLGGLGTKPNQVLATRRGGSSLAALRNMSSALANHQSENLDARIAKAATSPKVLAQASAILKENSAELVFIFDKSGSCGGTEKATIAGFNDLINQERKTGYKTTVSTILFNDFDTVVHDRIDINRVDGLNYSADGCTALYRTLETNLRRIMRFHDQKPTDAPKNTVVVIMTDGEDNRSKWCLEKAQRTIAECKKRGWKFIFLGAYINAKDTAQLLGIEPEHAENYDASDRGILINFQAVKNVLKSLRETGQINPDWAKDIRRNYLALGSGNNHQQPNSDKILRLGGR